MTVRITTQARLHFGFLDLSRGESGREFGGMGLALTRPRLVLRIEKAPRLVVEGDATGRIEYVAERVHHALELKPKARIVVEETIPEHVGLGSGTQLALALAAGIARQRGLDQPIATLCALMGRARRSGVGFHLFQRGGFVVEGGHKPGSGSAAEAPPLLARHPFPPDWRIMVALPSASHTVSGEAEEEAFRMLRPAADATVDRIARTVLTRLLPALVEHDLPAFGAALARTQELVGACFSSVQEGEFHPGAMRIAGRLREAKACGVGQSSWGPAIYAFAAGAKEEERLAGVVQAADPGATVLRVRGSNQGSSITATPSPARATRTGPRPQGPRLHPD
jgi:beta-ribofuranosylaminobenzene 5'-phosphate synthase